MRIDYTITEDGEFVNGGTREITIEQYEAFMHLIKKKNWKDEEEP